MPGPQAACTALQYHQARHPGRPGPAGPNAVNYNPTSIPRGWREPSPDAGSGPSCSAALVSLVTGSEVQVSETLLSRRLTVGLSPGDGGDPTAPRAATPRTPHPGQAGWGPVGCARCAAGPQPPQVAVPPQSFAPRPTGPSGTRTPCRGRSALT